MYYNSGMSFIRHTLKRKMKRRFPNMYTCAVFKNFTNLQTKCIFYKRWKWYLKYYNNLKSTLLFVRNISIVFDKELGYFGFIWIKSDLENGLWPYVKAAILDKLMF